MFLALHWSLVAFCFKLHLELDCVDCLARGAQRLPPFQFEIPGHLSYGFQIEHCITFALFEISPASDSFTCKFSEGEIALLPLVVAPALPLILARVRGLRLGFCYYVLAADTSGLLMQAAFAARSR